MACSPFCMYTEPTLILTQMANLDDEYSLYRTSKSDSCPLLCLLNPPLYFLDARTRATAPPPWSSISATFFWGTKTFFLSSFPSLAFAVGQIEIWSRLHRPVGLQDYPPAGPRVHSASKKEGTSMSRKTVLSLLFSLFRLGSLCSPPCTFYSDTSATLRDCGKQDSIRLI